MGLDAYVPGCNCYKEGKEFCDCEYEIELVSERISNWGGVRYFQQALAQIGWEHFPTLHAEIPDANGGFTSAQASAAALKELKYFKEHLTSITYPFLIDTEQDTILREYTEAYDGIFIMDGRHVFIGFDANGLFFIDPKDSKLLFRAKRVKQKVKGLINKQVVYIDQDTSKEFICQTPIEFEGRHPRYMHVEERSIAPDEYDYIIKPLTKVFRVSVKSGNPVCWC
jgi:hypothetical protein